MKRLLLVFALLTTLTAPAVAQEPPDSTVWTLRNGFFYAYQNEFLLLTKKSFNDPVKFRMGAWEVDSYLAIISGNLLSGDESNPRQDERGFFGIRHNDSYPKSVNAHEFVVNITDADCSGQDACQKTRMRVTDTFLELFGRRVNLDGGSAGNSLQSGAITIYMQADGNFVVYEMIGATGCPRWALNWLNSTYLGFVDRNVLAPPCNAPPTPGLIFN